MTKPKPAHLLKRRRREPDPLDTPEINAMLDGLLRTAKGPEDISGRGGILDQLSARCINRALAAEMELHLGHKIGEKPSEEQYNQRNGRTQKKAWTKWTLCASRCLVTATVVLSQPCLHRCGPYRRGTKDVLGLWFQDTEGAKSWLQVLSELRNRGIQDIFILCADGLKVLPEAVEASFLQALFQTCIVHVIRVSCRYVP